MRRARPFSAFPTKWAAVGGITTFNASGKAFWCWPKYWDVVLNAEVGASQAILGAGYNIGAMQRVYLGKDFRAVNSCLGVPDSDPTLKGGLVLWPNGTGRGSHILDPLEVVFVKHKHRVHSADAGRDALLRTEEADAVMRKRKADHIEPPRFTHVPIP
jgi:hypothetical protein